VGPSGTVVKKGKEVNAIVAEILFLFTLPSETK
jgi:hypothetical protein